MQSLNISRSERAGLPVWGAKSAFRASAPWACHRIPRDRIPAKFSKFSCLFSFYRKREGLWAPRLRDGRGQSISRHGIPVRMRLERISATELKSVAEVSDTEGCSDEIGLLSGFGASEIPVAICQTRTLDPVLSLDEGLSVLGAALNDSKKLGSPSISGIIRIQVPLPPGIKALQWLQGQPKNLRLPRTYFSTRAPRGDKAENGNDSSTSAPIQDVDECGFRAVAGISAAVVFHDYKPFSRSHWTAIQRFLAKGAPEIKVYGAMRFNPHEPPAEEWRPFGSFYFIIPQVEFCEGEGCSMLAVTVAWDTELHRYFEGAAKAASDTLSQISSHLESGGGQRTLAVISKEHVPSESAWHQAVNTILQKISGGKSSTISRSWPLDASPSDQYGLSKVVMARRTKLELSNDVDALTLLGALQEKDPSAYQFCIQLPEGTAFIGSTPERLFARKGFHVASEAVAATRARGDTSSEDLDKTIDLILSSKDHDEFEIVRESIRQNLERVCEHVEVESHKSIIKQARVQHLYGRFLGTLHSEASEFDLISVLHPTPAVCGHPQAPAREAITASESFDRGMYAGPVGWFGGVGSEFAVGIRSSLIESKSNRVNSTDDAKKGASIFLYAGVGVVKDSNPSSEWRELELKVSQFEALLQPSRPLEDVINVNALWAKLIVEECCRLGIRHFCIAPGSRSSPLAAAAAANPRITCISCIDERSLSFYAVGYGRGANKPAAVITSSGTAVSNLLPAVVEASQDCIPLLLLTADRPHELRDTSSNQTTDQVKQFGGYVRYFFDLPPADDKVPARMILTTLDSAVFRAITVPSGPVHINCPFREPLAGLSQPWNSACLKGLDRWIFSSSPFTTHIWGLDNTGIINNILEVVHEMKNAKRGLMVAGGLHTAEETWAVALLASHLGWPVVPDVLSGLRIGNIFSADTTKEDRLNIIQHFDQILLSESAADAIKPDVILQIGGRLTSKRVGNFLETSTPKAYILVEEHPFRADPSHVLTHRIQARTAGFASSLLKLLPKTSQDNAFVHILQTLSGAIGREIVSRLSVGTLITEPYAARAVASSIPSGSSLFLGNSMPIRDVEMYATGNLEQRFSTSFVGLAKLTASNRGASGIDGVLSTAIGYAAGSTCRVTLLVGDVSLLHDTNGLTLLKERVGQPPVTVVVVNNEGGGIFSLLPLKETVPSASLATLWSTEHNVSIFSLCRAHRVNHILVRTKKELEETLKWVGRSPLSWVVEVESNIGRNTEFHQFLQSSVMRAANRAFQVLSLFSGNHGQRNDNRLKTKNVELFQYKIPLSASLTTGVRGSSRRDGFLIRITLQNNISGVGEVAPLEGLHKESLEDVEEQLQLLLPMLKGSTLSPTLALLDGSFKSWLLHTIGVHVDSLFPSVRCGLEMAALDALASSTGCSLSELLIGRRLNQGNSQNFNGSVEGREIISGTQICALLDSMGSPNQVADAAATLVSQGFSALKLKVARRATPEEDAAIVRAVRERVGVDVHIRADANRKWSYQQAIEFAKLVRGCDLQYVEEPLEISQDIPRFCKESGLPVALDESVDEDVSTSYELLEKIAPGVVAVVIKPGRVGGLEQAASVAAWAQSRGMVAVISSAFESCVALSAYAHLAAYVNERWSETLATIPNPASHIKTVAHGLGTYTWLGGEIIKNSKFEVKHQNRTDVVPLVIACNTRHDYHFNEEFVFSRSVESVFASYSVKIRSGSNIFEFHVRDTRSGTSMVDESSPTLLFLHGFLGTSHDWLPIIRTLSSSYRCLAVDLPGHGETSVKQQRHTEDNIMSMELVSEALMELLKKLNISYVVPIGYSMGARIAIYLSLRYSEQILAVVSISGSPGLDIEELRKTRATQDALLAQTMKEGSLQAFLELWYQQPIWESLRQHPNFHNIKRERMRHTDKDALASSLQFLSVGQQPSLWEELGECSRPTLLVAGSLDTKFVNIARRMCERAGQQPQKARRSRKTSEARQEEDWESKDFRLPFDFVKEFPEVNMVVPSLNGLPKDDGFAAFFAQEMKKLQLEDTLALEAEDRPPNGWENNDIMDRHGIFQVAEVEDCGHAVHVENPFVLIRLLRKFLCQIQNS